MTTSGYIADKNFQRISASHYQYSSPAPERMGKVYDIRFINHHWTCNCPSAKELHKIGGRCKHERALCQIIDERIKQNAANRQAQEVAEREAERGELASLRDEIAKYQAAYEQVHRDLLESDQRQAEQLATFNERRNQELAAMRAELAEARATIQSQPAQTPDLAAIMTELAALREENAQIKKILATKATSRRKHMRETEAAMAKEAINVVLDDVVEQSQNAIQAVERARQQIKDLEAIPHELKAQLDRLAEEGQPELQPDYEPEERNSDEVRKAVREAQESDRARRSQTEKERRAKAPLNGNGGFSLLKK